MNGMLFYLSWALICIAIQQVQNQHRKVSNKRKQNV